MYSISVLTPPASEPVTVSQLKAQLRLNTTDEDSLLAGMITSARMMFEGRTNRAVMPTQFRQYLSSFDSTVYLMRGQVTSIDAVKYYDPSGTLQTSTTYLSDTVSLPAKIWYQTWPSTTYTLQPAASVDFTAGWTEPPALVVQGILLLAAHYFEHRAAWEDDHLTELPMGFRSVCGMFDCGLQGEWRELPLKPLPDRSYYPLGW